MNDKIVKIVITEYLCDHCDSVFLSPLLVQQHQKKSCMGVIKKEDERDELKKFEYKERHSANPSRCNGCGMIFIEKGIQNIAVKDFNEFKDVKEKKDFKCWECNEPNILKMIKDKISRDSYIKKFQ